MGSGTTGKMALSFNLRIEILLIERYRKSTLSVTTL